MAEIDSAGGSANEVDQPDQQARQPANRRRWLVIALALVLGGAFAVQATSTWRGGERHHLADLALPALVAVLEVGAVTGAAIYVATRNRGTRQRAGLLVAIVTGVGATFGVQAYGFLIGLPVASLLLLMVDLIGRFWHEDNSTAESGTSADQGGDSEQQSDGSEQQDEPDDEPEPPELPEVPNVSREVVERAAAILAREPSIGRPTLAERLDVKPYVALKLLTALRPLRDVRGEAS